MLGMYLDGASPGAPPRARESGPALPSTNHQQFRARIEGNGNSRMHIVEIRRDVGDVAEPMGRMRNWLDELE
jgi:hypothetical protein